MLLNEFDHLGDGFCGQNRKQVGDQQELVGLALNSIIRSESAKTDALALIRGATSAVDKWWVEPMHIEVLTSHGEALAHCHVAVSKRIAVEPTLQLA